MAKKLLSIVIPAYREEKNISLIYKAFKKIYTNIKDDYKYEIIYINDGSPDNTWGEICKLSSEDKSVYGINLSRNFGHQACLTAGLDVAKGDVIISLDCDLQDPPVLILKMLKKWETGAEVVYARKLNRHDRFMKKYTAILYYKLLSKVSDVRIPRDVGDFRLVDRKVLEAFKQLKEKDRYIRGIFSRMGFKTEFIDFDRPERLHGETGYTWKKMIKLAMDGILNFSTFPLKLGAVVGFFMIILSTFFFMYVIYDFTINGADYPLYKWINIALLGFMGLQFVFMWILGEYIGRIYNETRERPLYIVSDKVGFEK